MSETTKADMQREALETWAKWWDNVGRYHFDHHILPPLEATRKALGCWICQGIDLDGEICQACGQQDSRSI